MSELKLYRVVTLKIERENWCCGSGEWVNNESYEYLSARQVLGENGKEWQVFDCGTFESDKKALDFISMFEIEELMYCIVDKKVWPDDLIISGYFHDNTQSESFTENICF